MREIISKEQILVVEENLPIVMLTAKGEESDAVTGLELGAYGHVTKPFSPRILVPG